MTLGSPFSNLALLFTILLFAMVLVSQNISFQTQVSSEPLEGGHRHAGNGRNLGMLADCLASLKILSGVSVACGKTKKC